jgi:hypothetical protein
MEEILLLTGTVAMLAGLMALEEGMLGWLGIGMMGETGKKWGSLRGRSGKTNHPARCNRADKWRDSTRRISRVSTK